MKEQIHRGRTLLLSLLGAVCLMFLVNVFYPLYLGPPQSSHRIEVFFMMCTFAVLAYVGVRGMRVAISGVLFLLALVDGLVLLAILGSGRPGVSLAIGSIVFLYVLIGWLLLTSKDIRAFESARRQRPAKI